MEKKLITPQFVEALKNYPLYSQEGKGKNAVCVAVLFIGGIRWFVLEGQTEGNDFILFCIACGLCETEYSYVSANELEGVEVDGSKYGLDGKFYVCQDKGFTPTKLKNIKDNDLQNFLHRIYSMSPFSKNIQRDDTAFRSATDMGHTLGTGHCNSESLRPAG